VLLFLVYLKQPVPNNLFGVLIALVVPLQMEKSNLANHIQVFRQLVSAYLLNSLSFSVGACFWTGSVQSDYLLDNKLQKRSSSHMPDNGLRHHMSGEYVLTWIIILEQGST
jgi:hypothetical protein